MRLALILSAAVVAWANIAAAAPTIVSQGPAVQTSTEQFVLHSQQVNRDFLIEVTGPWVPPLPGQKLPAIYALDGGYFVEGQSVRLLTAGGAMAPAFVVSVGYVMNSKDGARYRNGDLMHVAAMQGEKMDGGGGAKFEAFLMDELRPFIDARYPTDPQQAILVGHSLGGLFAANVLAHRPDAFRAYLIASPSVWAAPDLTVRLRAAAPAGGGRRVFVGVGGLERQAMVEGAANVAAALSGPGSKFVVRRQIYEGQGHLSSYLMLAATALPFLLPPEPAQPPKLRTAISLDPAVLDRYVGVYRLDEKRTVTITRQEGQLFGQMTGQPPVQMFPEAPTSFFATVADAQARFIVGTNGRAQSLVLRLNGSEASATLIK